MLKIPISAGVANVVLSMILKIINLVKPSQIIVYHFGGTAIGPHGFADVDFLLPRLMNVTSRIPIQWQVFNLQLDEQKTKLANASLRVNSGKFGMAYPKRLILGLINTKYQFEMITKKCSLFLPCSYCKLDELQLLVVEPTIRVVYKQPSKQLFVNAHMFTNLNGSVAMHPLADGQNTKSLSDFWFSDNGATKSLSGKVDSIPEHLRTVYFIPKLESPLSYLVMTPEGELRIASSEISLADIIIEKMRGRLEVLFKTTQINQLKVFSFDVLHKQFTNNSATIW